MTGWRLSQLISVSNFNNEWSAWHVITVRCIRRPSDNTKLSAPTSACLNRTRHPALNSVWLNVFLMGVGQPVKEGGVEWRVVYFGKLVFESDEQEFSLRGVKSKKISSHPGKNVLKSVLKVRNAWVEVKWVKRDDELSITCVKVVVEKKKNR